jgi:tetratricopeptide (TPR) repeat protein
MDIRIGTFNNIPLHISIPAPLELFRQLFVKNYRFPIAYVRSEPRFYDQLKAKDEGSISIIPGKEYPIDEKFIADFFLCQKIVVTPYFFLLPKVSRLFILWHEYGHFIAPLNDSEGVESSLYNVYEALADFYACCKLKLHFNTYMETVNTHFKDRFRLRKKTYNTAHETGEERYQELYITRELPLNERKRFDYVYNFYRDKDALTDWYTFCFKEIADMDYQNYFDWNGFLEEIGWDNDEERGKYINYKKKPYGIRPDTERYDEAVKDYTETIRLRPNDGYAYYLRGDVYVLLQQYDQA